ncbi:methyl-accepting chemotaxis protein [Butyrivibrio sp. MC2013]|uniref:methyl-accepting chemotaxis protein n=1 Tax=Butyrivibrio sp. MC2013 TaxID=1280686 RepID=UPI000422D9B7|nr:methyl-accepting chemotaxis protein [Butyrivibrio sp. MC2013]
MAQSSSASTKKNRKLVLSIIKVAFLAVIIEAVVLLIVAATNIKKAYVTAFDKELSASCVQLDEMLGNIQSGDWAYDGSTLTRDGEPVYDAYKESLTNLRNNTGIEYTIFYGDTRIISTMAGVEGTKASDTVISHVLKGGNRYLAKNILIGDTRYYAYYIPIKNSDGKIVGMLYSGENATSVNKSLTDARIMMIIIAVIIIIIVMGIGLFQLKTSSAAIKDITGSLAMIREGDLTFKFTDATNARKDELGIIAEELTNLRDKLSSVISTTLELSGKVEDSGNSLSDSARGANEASDQVTSAISDISRSAQSQADSVTNSASNTEEIGNNVEAISSSIDTLNNAASEMMTASNRTVSTLDRLLQRNKEVMQSMEEIDAQIRATNDAVQEIANASVIINSISGQTNLLALNASIEAARAGDAGKGFAVVANEIGSLADQSGEAAVSIRQIVENLVAESQKSVDTIEGLKEGFSSQNEQLGETKNDMDVVMENVDNVDSEAKEIASKVKLLSSSKDRLNEIISSLSAISKDNVSLTSETNSSMENLNSAFEYINGTAGDLKKYADDLHTEVSFFKVGT